MQYNPNDLAFVLLQASTSTNSELIAIVGGTVSLAGLIGFLARDIYSSFKNGFARSEKKDDEHDKRISAIEQALALNSQADAYRMEQMKEMNTLLREILSALAKK